MNRAVFAGIFLFVVCLACRSDEPTFSPAPVGRNENITQLQVQVATPYVNVDTASQLLINYRGYDRKAQLWSNFLDFANGSTVSVDLFVDGVRQPANTSFQPSHPGVFTLQAKAGDLVSEPISVTARSAQVYEPVRLPVIFHFPTNADPTLMPLTTMLKEINQLYANQVKTTDPNQANAYIEFYLAERDPNGNLLAQPGLNRLPFSDQTTDSASAIKADSVVGKWCVKQYINVFVKLNWHRDTYPIGYSYVSTPGAYTNRPRKDIFTCDSYRSQYSGPAIMISSENYPPTLAHELGHYLGLPHTFALGCTTTIANYNILDTPRHTEDYPVNGQKRACRGAPFVATNVMDYYNQRANFTQDQVRSMRNTIDNPVFLPLPSRVPGGRLHTVSTMPKVACRNIGR
ncbi:MAG: hypothetical protein EOO39_17605 [Cytophagaceae bacterium]|nr:MAG: hypothetical protein EOO39_17605 [Cytophagaceae bacterium]